MADETGSDPPVAAFLVALEQLAAEVGDDVVLEACRRYLTDPQRGFEAALRQALGDGEGWPTPGRRP